MWRWWWWFFWILSQTSLAMLKLLTLDSDPWFTPNPGDHSVPSCPSSTSSSPTLPSGTPPSPWNSSSISCSPALPARDAHRAAPSRRPSERSSRAYSKNAASISLCANVGQGKTTTLHGCSTDFTGFEWNNSIPPLPCYVTGLRQSWWRLIGHRH